MKAKKITTLDQELEVLEETIDEFLAALKVTPQAKVREIYNDRIIMLQNEYRAMTGRYYRGEPYAKKN